MRRYKPNLRSKSVVNYERRTTNRWTRATGSEFRIIIGPAKLLGDAVARSTQPSFGGYPYMSFRLKFRNVFVDFLVATVLCAVNIYSYLQMPAYSTIDDGFVYFGWPFKIYAYGGYFGHAVILWTGLIGNVFVGLSARRILRAVVLQMRERNRVLVVKGTPTARIEARF